MKHKILLKSFLLLALILVFSSPAYASEVTGTLSSSGTQNGGSVGGSTTSGSGGGSGSSGRNFRTVESVSDVPTFATNSNGAFSSDGTAFGPSGDSLALEDGTPTSATVEPTMSSGLVATALGGFGDFSSTSWFSIVFLLLLLVAFFVYLYKRPLKKDKAVRV